MISIEKPKWEESNNKREINSLEKIVNPEHLELLADASGGFRFAMDESLPPERVGYTNMETRTIHINPLYLQSLPEEEIEGFLFHEAGHHSPEVKKFQDKLMENIDNFDIVPEEIRESPEKVERFFEALHSHLHNALADIWNESYMSRRPYFTIRRAINSLYENSERDSLKQFSKPEQLMQLLVGEARFEGKIPIKEMVDSDVYESYRRIIESGAFKTMEDRQAFENYFASLSQEEKTIARKIMAYDKVFLPEYLKLFDSEVKERAQNKRQGSDSQQDREGKEENKVGNLSEEEIQKIVDKLIKELKEAGDNFGSKTPAPEEQKNLEDSLNKARKEFEKELRGESKERQSEKGEEVEDKDKKGLEAISRSSNEMMRERKQESVRGLASEFQVSQETIGRWNEIKENYEREIESTAAALSDVFLDDRRRRLEYLKREGDIVPGLEHETIAALISGELDPDTRMKMVKNPEFLETELEFIVDTSGSMKGEKLEKSVDLLVVITEAFRKVREDLEAENLLAERENPFRLGVTKFASSTERVTKLEEELNEKKEVDIINEVSKVGGGTEETGALESVYKELKLGKDNVIKFIVIFTDGAGNKDGVKPIIEQIEEDDEVIFLAVGLGNEKDEAQNIVETYLEPLKDHDKNVYGIAKDNLEEVMPDIIDFIKREVEERRKS